MAAFMYQAMTPDGSTTKGVIEASNAAGARQILRDRRLMPISVTPTKSKTANAGGGLFTSRKIKNSALTLFTRQLSTLVASGIGVEEALKTVADQAGQTAVKSMLLNLRSSVLDGRSFAQALGDYPHVFGDYYRASVAAGEASGQLGQVMQHLASFVENRAKNRQTVQLALIYPAILALVSLMVIVALLTFVVPDIVRVFSTRGADLPFLTRALIAVSDFITSWGLVMLGGIAALIVGVGLILQSPKIRLGYHRMLARSRLTRHFVRKANAVQFSATLATLISSRVPLVDALTAATITVPNLYIRGELSQANTRVREGMALSKSLDRSNILPPMMIAMIASGEASGVLDQTLTRAADDQSRDLNALVATLVALVEPAVLMLMGGIVMLLVLAIMLPIVSLNNLVG